MPPTAPTSTAEPVRTPRRAGALVLALFAASGCAALVYQVVWLEQLSLVVGSSAVSLGVLLATFLLGLGLGSALAGLRPNPRPLARLARIELAIGALGLAALYLIPLLGTAYLAAAPSGPGGLVLRVAVAALCLLPATTLMGTTLPVVADWFRAEPDGMRSIGFCYAANTCGAVVGSLVAGFYLLREYDAAVATLVAATLNLGAAAGAAALAARAATAETPLVGRAAERAPPAWLHVVTGLSGFAALLSEVVWTRHLSLLLGNTVYTFALILAAFLLALGIGAAAGSAVGQRFDARRALAACQWLAAAGIAWGAFVLARALPYWPLDVTLPTPPGAELMLDVTRAALVVTPGALLWGASFPLVLAAARRGEREARQVVGSLYAANTAGAILGALATSLVLIPLVGSAHAQRIAIAASAGAALLLALPGVRTRRGALAPFAALLGALGLAWGLPELPPQLVAYGRFLPTRGADANVVYVGEGLTASIAVTQEPSGILTYHNAGKTQASTYPQDMRLQRMLGHLATLLIESPSSVLVVGLGAGVTAGAVSLDPSVERVVVAEIEPLVAEAAARYFARANFAVLDDPRVELHIDDARHWLATTDERFDAITSDPLDPWVRGAAALYTREFWQLCRARLNDGGIVTVFVQLYESTADTVRSELATFLEVFPGGLVFANTVDGEGYDLVLVGRRDDARIDLTRLERRLDTAPYAPLAASLREVGFESGLDLLSTYTARGADLAAWLAGAPINTDRNLRLQYLAGRGINTFDAAAIFADLARAAPEFPHDVFTGTPAQLEELRQRLAGRSGRY